MSFSPRRRVFQPKAKGARSVIPNLYPIDHFKDEFFEKSQRITEKPTRQGLFAGLVSEAGRARGFGGYPMKQH
jgi:hypothetical protein